MEIRRENGLGNDGIGKKKERGGGEGKTILRNERGKRSRGTCLGAYNARKN